MTYLPPAPPATLQLRAPRASSLLFTLAVAWGGGGFVGLLSLAAAVTAAEHRYALLAIALLALAPAAWVSWRWYVLSRPSRLRVTGEALIVEFPWVLREPLVIPAANVRAAAVDEAARLRFRIHATSGPYVASDDDAWLWGDGSALAVLTDDHVAPNLALLLDPPVPAPRLRRETAEGPRRGERMPALLLAVADAGAAEGALERVVPLRPFTMPDRFALAAGFGSPRDAPRSGSRAALQKRYFTRWGWIAAAAGFVLPLIGLVAVYCAIAVWRFGRRVQAVAIACLGLVGAAATLYSLLT
jgi:hypothetical protein